MLPGLEGVIGNMDLVKIRMLYKNPDHSRWFNGRKKMCNNNKMVLVNNDGLTICVDHAHPGSIHDVTCLHQSKLDPYWRQYFMHTNEYFEMVLGDASYVGADMYILHRMGRMGVPFGVNLPMIDAFNKMHSSFKVRVEWE